MGRKRKNDEDLKERVIVRQYFSKKKNEWITKTYKYKYRQTNQKVKKVNKKTGEVTYKIYNPAPKAPKAPKKYKKLFKDSNLTNQTKFVNKTGEIRMKQVKEFARITQTNELDVLEYVKSRFKEGIQVNANALKARYSENQVSRFLMNLGVDIDELVNSINEYAVSINANWNVDRNWLVDLSRWKVIGGYRIDGPLILPDGSYIEFDWDYAEGTIYTIVKAR